MHSRAPPAYAPRAGKVSAPKRGGRTSMPRGRTTRAGAGRAARARRCGPRALLGVRVLVRVAVGGLDRQAVGDFRRAVDLGGLLGGGLPGGGADAAAERDDALLDVHVDGRVAEVVDGRERAAHLEVNPAVA